jgi:hypothetical protein
MTSTAEKWITCAGRSYGNALAKRILAVPALTGPEVTAVDQRVVLLRNGEL